MSHWLNNIPKPIWMFTAVWFVLGLVQSALMELHPDEAYYWQMSRFMDWGYFHQPPMVAVFIKVGYALFQNELGVRLMTVIASSLGILLLFNLSETKSPKTFVLIFLGLILTHAGAFMAVPDSPLVFFTLVFLILLREYVNEDKFITAIGLGIVAAALMYSKYHAIVLFASVIFATPKLLLRKSFWLAVAVGVALFVPHVIWQYDHDLISFKFHWVIREKREWTWLIAADYVGGQLALLGPVGLLLLYAVFRWSSNNDFERILRSITLGFFAFFFMLSLRGTVEANWTATAFLPLIILGSRSISPDERLFRVLRPVSIAVFTILVIARIYLASPLAGKGIDLNFAIRGWKNWATAIREKADGKPVFFSGTYQLASEYSFYSGEQGYHFSPVNYNGNQFDLWDIDREVEGRPYVLVVGYGNDPTLEVRAEGFRPTFVYPLENYHSYRDLRFEFEERKMNLTVGSTLELPGKLTNYTDEVIDLDSLLSERPVNIFHYWNRMHFPSEPIRCNGCSGRLDQGASKPVSFTVQVPNEPGKHFIRFGLDFALGVPEQNSDFIQLSVTEK